jgi:hypothetical protein
MARRWVAGIAVVWVLASGLGLGYDRLHAQSREALVTQGRQFFTDKGCYAQAFTGLDRSTPMSSITTRAYSHFPRPDLHRQETRHYGLQTKTPSREGTHSMDHQRQYTCVFPSPSKIPYGGFSPVRLQTSLTQQPPSSAKCSPLIGCHCSCPRPQRFTRNRTCVQAALRALTRTTDPVALGSPSGSIVRPDHCLLWPHLRLCRPPAGLWIIPSGCEPVPAQPQRVPNLLCQSLRPCRRPYSGGPHACR